MKNVEQQKNIVVARLSAMGDVAMTVPVIVALVEQNPSVKVTMLTTPFHANFFKDIPSLDICVVDLKSKHKSLWGVFRLFLHLVRRKRYSMFIDLHDVIRTKFLRKLYRLIGTPVYVIDKGRHEKELLTQQGDQKRLVPLKSTIERYADTFRAAGFNLTLAESKPKQNRPLPASIKAKFPHKDCLWVGLAPFAQHLGKIYPIHLLIDLLSKIEARGQKVNIFLFGGGTRERDITESLERQFSFCHSVVGRLSIHEELDLIANLDSMVSMDSSAMHLSSIVGTRVISVWGATHHYAGFLGYGQSPDDIVSVDLACRPCSIYGNKPCYKNNYECLFGIKSESVIEKIFN